MMTATPNFFCLIQTLFADHFLLKAFFQIFTFEKNLNFCSENWLHLFSSLWLSPTVSLICPKCSATPAHAVAMTEQNPRKKNCLASQDLLFFSKKKVGHALKIASFCHDTGGYGADYFYCNNTMKQVVPVLFLYQGKGQKLMGKV